MYKEMGRAFESLDTWSVYMLTSNEQFEEVYGRKATKNGSSLTVLSKRIIISTGLKRKNTFKNIVPFIVDFVAILILEICYE